MNNTVLVAIGTIITAIAGIVSGFGVASEAMVQTIAGGATSIVSGVFTIIMAFKKESEVAETEMALREMTALASVNHAE